MHSVRFDFSTGRCLEHPGFETLLDNELVAWLVNQDREAVMTLPREQASQAVLLNAKSGSQLLDLMVFSVLFLADQNESLRLGNQVGSFFSTLRASARPRTTTRRAQTI